MMKKLLLLLTVAIAMLALPLAAHATKRNGRIPITILINFTASIWFP